MNQIINTIFNHIIDFAIQTKEVIGFLNLFFCLTLMLVGTLAKMFFDRQDKIVGRTNKVINWVTIIVGLIYWYKGGVLHELVFTALAFQRAFELVFHWIERLYIWLFLVIYGWIKPKIKPILEPITNRIKKWFDFRIWNP